MFFDDVLNIKKFPIDRLGRVFVDFRGLIVGTPESPGWNVFQQPFYRSASSDDLPHHRTKNGTEWWNNKFQSFWPFVVAEKRVDFLKYEFTASRMLGGRALYVTALGAQPSPYLKDGKRFPLLYFMYVDAKSTWQIGRLVDRIHHLGTVRVAAIMGLDTLHAAGVTLREIEGEIDKASTVVPAKAPETTEALFASITRIQNLISSVDMEFDSGLEYRIERSRYYVKQFRDGIAPLRIRRLEGFQPYNVFVERRLASVFYFIDMLGVRRDQVLKDQSILYQSYFAKNANDIARDIGIRNQEIATRNQEIATLQTFGEFLLFLVPIPYYAGMVLTHLLFGESDGFTVGAIAPVESVSPPVTPPLPFPLFQEHWWKLLPAHVSAILPTVLEEWHVWLFCIFVSWYFGWLRLREARKKRSALAHN